MANMNLGSLGKRKAGYQPQAVNPTQNANPNIQFVSQIPQGNPNQSRINKLTTRQDRLQKQLGDNPAWKHGTRRKLEKQLDFNTRELTDLTGSGRAGAGAGGKKKERTKQQKNYDFFQRITGTAIGKTDSALMDISERLDTKNYGDSTPQDLAKEADELLARKKKLLNGDFPTLMELARKESKIPTTNLFGGDYNTSLRNAYSDYEAQRLENLPPIDLTGGGQQQAPQAQAPQAQPPQAQAAVPPVNPVGGQGGGSGEAVNSLLSQVEEYTNRPFAATPTSPHAFYAAKQAFEQNFGEPFGASLQNLWGNIATALGADKWGQAQADEAKKRLEAVPESHLKYFSSFMPQLLGLAATYSGAGRLASIAGFGAKATKASQIGAASSFGGVNQLGDIDNDRRFEELHGRKPSAGEKTRAFGIGGLEALGGINPVAAGGKTALAKVGAGGIFESVQELVSNLLSNANRGYPIEEGAIDSAAYGFKTGAGLRAAGLPFENNKPADPYMIPPEPAPSGVIPPQRANIPPYNPPPQAFEDILGNPPPPQQQAGGIPQAFGQLEPSSQTNPIQPIPIPPAPLALPQYPAQPFYGGQRSGQVSQNPQALARHEQSVFERPPNPKVIEQYYRGRSDSRPSNPYARAIGEVQEDISQVEEAIVQQHIAPPPQSAPPPPPPIAPQTPIPPQQTLERPPAPPSAPSSEALFNGEHIKQAPLPITEEQQGSTTIKTRQGDIDTIPSVVSAKDLKFATGELQNRDLGRDASDHRVQNILTNFDPNRLTPYSPESQSGSIITTPDGTIISGNGRFEALKKIYSKGGKNAANYRNALKRWGHKGGIESPIAVRVIPQEYADQLNLEDLVNEANTPTTQDISIPERAKAAGKKLREAGITSPPDIRVPSRDKGIANMVFDAAGVNGRGQFIDRDGNPNKAGRDLINATLLEAAYGDNGGEIDAQRLIEKATDETDSEGAAIANGLIGAAPQIIAVRTAINTGGLPAEYDISRSLMDTLNEVEAFRRGGRKNDLFATIRAPALIDKGDSDRNMKIARLYYASGYHKDGTEHAGRWRGKETIADSLTYYSKAALGQGSEGLDLGQATPNQLLDEIASRLNQTQNEDLFNSIQEESKKKIASDQAEVVKQDEAVKEFLTSELQRINPEYKAEFIEEQGDDLVAFTDNGNKLVKMGGDLESATPSSVGTFYHEAFHAALPLLTKAEVKTMNDYFKDKELPPNLDDTFYNEYYGDEFDKEINGISRSTEEKAAEGFANHIANKPAPESLPEAVKSIYNKFIDFYKGLKSWFDGKGYALEGRDAQGVKSIFDDIYEGAVANRQHQDIKIDNDPSIRFSVPSETPRMIRGAVYAEKLETNRRLLASALRVGIYTDGGSNEVKIDTDKNIIASGDQVPKINMIEEETHGAFMLGFNKLPQKIKDGLDNDPDSFANIGQHYLLDGIITEDATYGQRQAFNDWLKTPKGKQVKNMSKSFSRKRKEISNIKEATTAMGGGQPIRYNALSKLPIPIQEGVAFAETMADNLALARAEQGGVFHWLREQLQPIVRIPEASPALQEAQNRLNYTASFLRPQAGTIGALGMPVEIKIGKDGIPTFKRDARNSLNNFYDKINKVARDVKIDKKGADLIYYLQARHNATHKVDNSNRPKKEEDIAHIKMMDAKMAGNKDWAEGIRIYEALIKGAEDLQLASGLVSQEIMNKQKNAFPNYFPSIKEGENKIFGGGKFSGSTRQEINPIAAIAAYLNATQTKANANWQALGMADMIDDYGGELGRGVDYNPTTPSKSTEAIKAMSKELESIVRDLGNADKMADVMSALAQRTEANKEFFVAFRNGEPKIYQIKDRQFMALMSALNTDYSSWQNFRKLTSKYSRAISTDPFFVMWQLTGDIIMSGLQSGSTNKVAWNNLKKYRKIFTIKKFPELQQNLDEVGLGRSLRVPIAESQARLDQNKIPSAIRNAFGGYMNRIYAVQSIVLDTRIREYMDKGMTAPKRTISPPLI